MTGALPAAKGMALTLHERGATIMPSVTTTYYQCNDAADDALRAASELRRVARTERATRVADAAETAGNKAREAAANLCDWVNRSPVEREEHNDKHRAMRAASKATGEALRAAQSAAACAVTEADRIA